MHRGTDMPGAAHNHLITSSPGRFAEFRDQGVEAILPPPTDVPVFAPMQQIAREPL